MSEMSFEESCNVILDAAGDQFCKFKFSHVRALDGNGHAVIVMAYCLNLLRMKLHNDRDRKKLKRDDLWFQCPAKDIQKNLGMSQTRQAVAIRNLVEAGLLQTKHGAGFKQWIKVDTDKLDKIEERDRRKRQRLHNGPASDRITGSLATAERPRSYTKNPSEKQSNGRPEANGVNGFNGHSKSRPFEEGLASKLRIGLMKSGKLMREPHLPAWTREISLLVSEIMSRDSKSRPEAEAHVADIIQDHLTNISDKYQPRCRSAGCIRERFVDLEEAKSRRKVNKEENTYVGW